MENENDNGWKSTIICKEQWIQQERHAVLCFTLFTFQTWPLRKVVHFCQKLVFRAVSTLWHPFSLSISLIALTAFSERPKMVPVSICLHPISFSIDRLCVSYSLGRLSVFKLLRQRGSLGFRLYFKLVVYFRDENASQFCNIWFDSLQQCLGSSAGCFSYWNCDSLTWIFTSSGDSRGPWIWSRSKRCGH